MADRIVIADDHPIFREGMRRTVQRAFPVALVQEAETVDGVRRIADADDRTRPLAVSHRPWPIGKVSKTNPISRHEE